MSQRPKQTIPGRMRRLVDFARRDIWLAETAGLPRTRALGLRLSRVLVLTARGFQQHRLTVQAAALTYYTVLSLVPILAVSFAVARGLGAYDDLKEKAINPALDRYLGAVVTEDDGATASDELALEVAVVERGAAAGGEQPAEEGAAAGGEQPVEEGAAVGDEQPEEEGAAVDSELSAEVAPQGGDLRTAIDQVIGLVDKTNDLPIGMLGLALLLYTAVKLLSAVERSLNEVWGLQRGRSWARRFSDYIAIVVVTPILLLVGATATATLRALRLQSMFTDHEINLGPFMAFVLQAAPLAVIWLGLAFAYMAMPNTRVRVKSAIMGGGAAAFLWVISQYMYVELQVGIAKYNALYGVFASLPILLFWVFLSWTIFLIGAELSYAHQSVPLFTSIARMGSVDHAYRESLALRLCGRIADAFLGGRESCSAGDLANELGVAPRAVNGVLEDLVEHGILVRTGEGDDDRFVPARDPESIEVLDILTALKSEEGTVPLAANSRLDERIDRILDGLETESRASLHNYTLRELALSTRESDAPAPDAAGNAATSELNPREAR